MRLALYQPDIPQNTGAMLRLAACLAVAVDLIEPCGFVWSDRRLRRAGMDYLEGVELTRGVTEGEKIVVRGIDPLSDGAPVKIGSTISLEDAMKPPASTPPPEPAAGSGHHRRGSAQ